MCQAYRRSMHAFTALAGEVSSENIKKDCCLIVDAMAIRKQTMWEPKKERYAAWFVDYDGQGSEDESLMTQTPYSFGGTR